MKKIPFVIKYPKKKGFTSISYGVGQGMGLYSSWSSMALFHHFIVRYCGLLNGKKGFEDYLILGDDVLIAGEEVALTYKIHMENIGIKINLSKSVVPGISADGAEFASRFVKNDIDFSPLPIGLVPKKDLFTRINLCTAIMERFLSRHTNMNFMIVNHSCERNFEILLKAVFRNK